jgi:hypothetical protein
MENSFIYATIISVIFFIIKFIEMRFINRETKPLKVLFMDSFIVFICSILAQFVFEQFDNAKDLINSTEPTQVFMGKADF